MTDHELILFYIARRDCGCLVGASIKPTAKELGNWILDGLRVSRFYGVSVSVPTLCAFHKLAHPEIVSCAGCGSDGSVMHDPKCPRVCRCWFTDNTLPGGFCRNCGKKPDLVRREAEYAAERKGLLAKGYA